MKAAFLEQQGHAFCHVAEIDGTWVRQENGQLLVGTPTAHPALSEGDQLTLPGATKPLLVGPAPDGWYVHPGDTLAVSEWIPVPDDTRCAVYPRDRFFQ